MEVQNIDWEQNAFIRIENELILCTHIHAHKHIHTQIHTHIKEIEGRKVCIFILKRTKSLTWNYDG